MDADGDVEVSYNSTLDGSIMTIRCRESATVFNATCQKSGNWESSFFNNILTCNDLRKGEKL